MADIDHQDEQAIIVDGIDDAIVTDTRPQQRSVPLYRNCPGWPRISLESHYALADPLLNVPWQSIQCVSGRWPHLDLVRHLER